MPSQNILRRRVEKVIKQFKNLRNLIKIDSRIVIVVYGLIASIVVTIIIWSMGIWRNPNDFMGAVFSSWVAGVLLFSVVGVTAAVAGLTRPEAGSFDERARILFKKQDGKHIDYIVHRLKSAFEHYAEKHTEIHIIREYIEAEKKFLQGSESIVEICSYIDDTDTTYPISIKFEGITPAPVHYSPNRLNYIRLNGVAIKGAEVLSGDRFEFDHTTKVPAKAKCHIQHSLDLWIVEGHEENVFRPIRYIKELELFIENHLSCAILATIYDGNQTECEKLKVAPGARIRAYRSYDIEPQKLVFDARYTKLDES